jgi:hypothetical protein
LFKNEAKFAMDVIKTSAPITILFFLLFVPLCGFPMQQEGELVKAIRLYDEENFEQAEVILKKLLDEKPDHLMVNYYYGACRTENGHYGTNEIIYLLNGSIGESPLKTDYYIGVQYHAKNRWEEALKHYTRFKNKATEEEQKEVALSEKIQMCYAKENPFVEAAAEIQTDVLPAALPRAEKQDSIQPLVDESLMADTHLTDTLRSDGVTVDSVPEQVEVLRVVPEKKGMTIDFLITNEISYSDTSDFKTEGGLANFLEGHKKKEALERQQNILKELREDYAEERDYTEKQMIGEQILEIETDLYGYQREVNQLFLASKQSEMEYWQSASTAEKESFLALQNNNNSQSSSVEEMVVSNDSTEQINPALFLVNDELPAAEEQTVNDELVYKIQLGAYSRGLPAYVKRLFDKLSYIRKIDNYTDENGVVVYTTGKLSNYDDALKMQEQVRREGVEDAFVVPYFKGKRITLEEAKDIESGK